MNMVRLQKILSHAGLASRRLAEELIVQGRVSVNGQVASQLGTKADPDRDEIKVDGRRIKAPPRQYFLLFKPRSVVSTRADPQRRTTVIDLLEKHGVGGYFYPVGRLDYESEGLIILTNDGAFAEKVSHPRYELERVYEARVRGVPDDHDLSRLAHGLVIEGRRTQPAKSRLLKIVPSASGPQGLIELILREGRNRQVRLMCDAIGHPVVRLTRTRIGSIAAKAMRPGDIRELTLGEIRSLTEGDQGKRSAPAGPRPAPRTPAKSPRARRERS